VLTNTKPTNLTAVELFYRHLGALPHPSGLVRLVQFSHDSSGLQKLKRHVSEALVLLLENAGIRLCDTPQDAALWLTGLGWTVNPPEPGHLGMPGATGTPLPPTLLTAAAERELVNA
jgi:hypothetical protein